MTQKLRLLSASVMRMKEQKCVVTSTVTYQSINMSYHIISSLFLKFNYSRNPSNRNRNEIVEEPVQHVDVEPSRITTRPNEVAAVHDDDTITRVASTTLNNNFILVDGRVRFSIKNWIYCVSHFDTEF